MNRSGLTLLEVLIAVLILSLSVGGILLIFSTEKVALSSTQRKMQGIGFCAQTLEHLKNEVGEDSWNVPAQPLSLVPPTHTTEGFLTLAGTELGDRFGASRIYDVAAGPVPDSYREVSVTVDWTEPD